MPLYEYRCSQCKNEFELLTSQDAKDLGRCPKCGSQKCVRVISIFSVKGRGDVRESTLHGCHEHEVSGPHEGDAHSHNHSHHSDD